MVEIALKYSVKRGFNSVFEIAIEMQRGFLFGYGLVSVRLWFGFNWVYIGL